MPIDSKAQGSNKKGNSTFIIDKIAAGNELKREADRDIF
jgi:hypothetical protein